MNSDLVRLYFFPEYPAPSKGVSRTSETTDLSNILKNEFYLTHHIGSPLLMPVC
jgi:hypothetical protein